MNKLNAKSDKIVLNGPADIEMSSLFTEYCEVTDYDLSYEVYLHTYHKDGILYTFVTDPGVNTFYFYFIMAENLADIE